MSTTRTLFIVLAVLILCGNVLFAAPTERPDSASKAGEIRGTLDYCGPQGNDGAVVRIVSRSFQATLGASGDFYLNYVPAGTYNLVISIPGRSSWVVANVAVNERTVTDLGIITVCRDADLDTFTEADDCNDDNPNINPTAGEVCDGYDNNCDGTVDEDCDLCTDADNDGFYAQAGCLTQIDCNDSDATIRPNAVELCDALDNNCNGSVDEGLDLSADPANCGDCGNVCSYQNASGNCVGGICEMASCSGGWGDCDATSDNGCETDLTDDGNNCGGCGAICDDNLTCTVDFCAGGSCAANLDPGSCLIDNTCYPSGAMSPVSSCMLCDPTVNQYAWTPRPAGSACGDPTNGPCDNPDTCSPEGICVPNHAPSSTVCRAASHECDVEEVCDGTGNCPPDAFRADGTNCGATGWTCQAGVCQTCEPPAITSVEPGQSCESAPTPLTVYGANFATDATIIIDGTSYAVLFVSPNEITTLEAISAQPGVYDVIVRNGPYCDDTLIGGFEVVSPPHPACGG